MAEGGGESVTSANTGAPTELFLSLGCWGRRGDTVAGAASQNWLHLGWSSSGPVAVRHKRQREKQVAAGRGCLRFVTAVRPLWNSSNSLCAAVSFLQLLSYP